MVIPFRHPVDRRCGFLMDIQSIQCSAGKEAADRIHRVHVRLVKIVIFRIGLQRQIRQLLNLAGLQIQRTEIHRIAPVALENDGAATVVEAVVGEIQMVAVGTPAGKPRHLGAGVSIGIRLFFGCVFLHDPLLFGLDTVSIHAFHTAVKHICQLKQYRFRIVPMNTPKKIRKQMLPDFLFENYFSSLVSSALGASSSTNLMRAISAPSPRLAPKRMILV